MLLCGVMRVMLGPRSFVHAMARRGFGLGVMCGLCSGLFCRGLFDRGEAGAMRRRRFHPPGEDEGYGEGKANADQPLDHATKMALAADLSI